MDTNFNNYLHKLLVDDEALKMFLGDPNGQSDQHGLTKAERAVLRRVVNSASNGSVNGYAIIRPLSGYRQAVRLVQNVMHNNMSAMIAASNNTHTLNIYMPTGALTAGSNGSSYANPWGEVSTFHGSGTTIGELMDSVMSDSSNGFSFDTEQNEKGEKIITAITIKGSTLTAPPPKGITSLSETTPFWFWTLNGEATNGATEVGYEPGDTQDRTKIYYGQGQRSYENVSLSAPSVVYWQVINPSIRGFGSCGIANGQQALALS